MMANCFFKVTMKHLKTFVKGSSLTMKRMIDITGANLNPWKSRLQTVDPVGGSVSGAHLNIHIQWVEARARVAFSPS